MKRAIAALLAVLMVPAASGQERLAVPGTSVSMVPPAGFAVASDFSGFGNEATGDSIVVVEFPAEAFDHFSEMFADPEGARSIGIEIAATETLVAAGREVIVLRGTQRSGEVEIGKWLALTGPEPTVLVTIDLHAPDALGEEAVRAILGSLEIGTTMTGTMDAGVRRESGE